MSGTALAHVVTFLATPLITRLFLKESLGDWQLYISTVTLFGVVASLKYEMSIVLPKDENQSNELAVLSLASLLVFSLVFTLILSVWGKKVLGLLKAESLYPFLYFISLGVFVFGLWQAVQYVFVRRKKFGVLAANKVVQVAVMHIIAVVIGFFKPSPAVLIVSQILGWTLAAAVLFFGRPVTFNVPIKRLWQSAKTYKKFPTVNTSMVFMNTLSLQLPVFMLSRFFGTDIVALYAMANRIVNIPLFMIGRSVQQVYFQSASEAKHHGRDALLSVYKSTVKKLALFALVPLGILLFFGPPIARIYFGPGYQEAGVYMQIITFWMFFQFINSPISTTFTILDKQQIGFYLIALSLLSRIVVMILFHSTPRVLLAALSLSTGLFYLIYNMMIYYFIKKMEE